VSNASKTASLIYTIINERYHFMTSSDWFSVPVRLAVKSNLINWCCQNLSKHALHALTVQASTTELASCSKYLQCVQRKNASVSHNERMILQFIIVASGVSSFVERKIG